MDDSNALSRRAAQLLTAASDSESEENIFDDGDGDLNCDLSLGAKDDIPLSLSDPAFLSQSSALPSTIKRPRLDIHEGHSGIHHHHHFASTSDSVPKHLPPDVGPANESMSCGPDTDNEKEHCHMDHISQPLTPEQCSQNYAAQFHNLHLAGGDLPADESYLSQIEQIPPLHVMSGDVFSNMDHTPDSPQTEIGKNEFGADYFWNYCSDDDTPASSPCPELPPLNLHAPVDSESDEEAVEVQETATGDQEMPIYTGASLNIWESLTCILKFAQTEHISGVGLGRLLSLINLHLPQPNNFMKSSHSLFKMLEDLDEPIEIHHFCSVCYKTRKSLSDLCDTCADESRSVHYFITFPLAPQVRKMFKRPDFVQSLRYNQTRVKKNVNNIEDIFDGEVYKTVEGFRQTTDGITFLWNTDGIPIFTSNTYSLWPFYLVINELSPEKRFLSENLIIAGIWGSVTKPHPNVYLLPIYKELKILKNGIEVQYYGEEETQKVTGTVICGSCDAPATASFLNMKTHSGFYSCPVCVLKGAKPGDATVFPYEENVPLRNMEEYHEHVKLSGQHRVILSKSVRNDDRFCGIKGPTILSKIVDNIFASTAIDSMHCLYLGVMRQMLRLWFIDGKYQDKAKLVSLKLLELAPPHFLQRLPQAIEKLVHWKATELRSFLFNLSMLLLRDVLDPEDYNHFSLFVKGVSLLNSSSISEEDLRLAETLLSQFVREFESLYGVDNMSHNLHMCLHLHQCVKSVGPLWCVSCFKFEDINGRLLNLIHGTRHIGLQIHSNIGVITHLPVMIHNLREGPAKDYCTNLSRRYRLKISDQISSGLHCVGKFSAIGIDKAWIVGVLKNENVLNPKSQTLTFHRLLKNNLLYVSSSYKRGDRVSSYVKFQKNSAIKYGNIICFVKILCNCSENCLCPPEYMAIIKGVPTVPVETDVVVFNHLFRCDTSVQVESFFQCDVVTVSDLLTVMFKIEDSGNVYLSEPLNNYELE